MKKVIYIGNKLEDHGATPTSVDILSKLLSFEGYNVISASTKKNKFLRLIEMQLIILKNFKNAKFVLIDTYSTQNFWYAYVTGRICKILKLKYIPILRGGNLIDRILTNEKETTELFKNSHLNIAPSLFMYEFLKTRGFENVMYIPNSIPLRNYSFNTTEKVSPHLLWVRAFDEIYNPLLALKTLKELTKIYPEASLCMVGPDKDGSLAACRKYAEKHTLRVRFTGKLKKKEWIQLSEAYDIFINTSAIDNTPVSVIEAMALGLPVVSTKVGGIPYLIDDTVNGMLVPPNDPGAMKEKIQYLIENPEFAKSLALKGRAKTAEFDWDIIKIEWSKVLT